MFRKAIVVMCHPEDHSVDLVMCDDGARLSGVPVLSPNASARSGGVDMPEMPEKTGEAKWDITERHGQDMEAMVAMMGAGNPVVVGFMFPQVSQMTFKDKKRTFKRHQSDVYHTIDGDGNFEFHHPSGAYIRIAESTNHEDLEKKNFDENLEFDRNKDKKIHIHLSTQGGRAYITLGEGGTITVQAEKTVSIAAGDAIDLTAPQITLRGNVDFSNGHVKHDGVDVGKTHKHTSVRTGTDQSGPPVG